MSGPKSSDYTLTAQQRRRLEEERKRREEEERRRREEERKRREEEERRRREEERKRREEEERRRREEAERKRREEEERRRRAEEERRRKEAERQAKVKAADNNIDMAFSAFPVINIPDKESIEETKIKNNETNNSFDGTPFINKLNTMLADINLSDSLALEIKSTISRFDDIKDSTYRKNFAAITINPLLKKCKKHLALAKENSDLIIQYETLCSLANEQPIRIEEFSSKAIQHLTDEVKRLNLKIAENDEKAYIQKSLDEVMVDMGYDVIGYREVTKRNGRHFKNELYSYSDGTAVNITFSDDGHVAMELCGLDDTDRTPETAEADQLCKHMESFCQDFTEIEKRLAAKGVIVKNRLHMLPPSAEHAQIVNINDYNVTREVDNFNLQRKRDIKSHSLHRSV